jgi:cytochrome c oxidase subunit IV
VAVVLAIITIAEVAIYYIDSLRSILVEALLIMSAIKFVTVVSYFMHLKFDDRRFAWTFGLAMIVALSIVIGFEVLFRFHAIEYSAVDFLT